VQGYSIRRGHQYPIHRWLYLIPWQASSFILIVIGLGYVSVIVVVVVAAAGSHVRGGDSAAAAAGGAEPPPLFHAPPPVHVLAFSRRDAAATPVVAPLLRALMASAGAGGGEGGVLDMALPQFGGGGGGGGGYMMRVGPGVPAAELSAALKRLIVRTVDQVLPCAGTLTKPACKRGRWGEWIEGWMNQIKRASKQATALVRAKESGSHNAVQAKTREIYVSLGYLLNGSLRPPFMRTLVSSPSSSRSVSSSRAASGSSTPA
jgi:hypothetical protein